MAVNRGSLNCRLQALLRSSQSSASCSPGCRDGVSCSSHPGYQPLKVVVHDFVMTLTLYRKSVGGSAERNCEGPAGDGGAAERRAGAGEEPCHPTGEGPQGRAAGRHMRLACHPQCASAPLHTVADGHSLGLSALQPAVIPVKQGLRSSWQCQGKDAYIVLSVTYATSTLTQCATATTPNNRPSHLQCAQLHG